MGGDEGRQIALAVRLFSATRVAPHLSAVELVYSRPFLMPSSLDSTLHDLAEKFASSVMEELRSVTLDELMEGADRAPIRKQSARFPKGALVARDEEEEGSALPGSFDRGAAEPAPAQPPVDAAKALDLVTKLVRANPKGLRSEELRKMLGLQAMEMARVLKEAMAQKKLKSRGQKRATTYFAA